MYMKKDMLQYQHVDGTLCLFSSYWTYWLLATSKSKMSPSSKKRLWIITASTGSMNCVNNCTVFKDTNECFDAQVSQSFDLLFSWCHQNSLWNVLHSSSLNVWGLLSLLSTPWLTQNMAGSYCINSVFLHLLLECSPCMLLWVGPVIIKVIMCIGPWVCNILYSMGGN